MLKPRYKSRQEFKTADPNAYNAACRLGLLPELFEIAGIDDKTGNSNTNDFVTKANIKHGDKYNYDKVVYKGAHKKVIITCPQHGDFEQKPSNHLSGQGCPKCGGTIKSNEGDFVTKAKTEHGDKYNYDKVVYTTSRTKVIITCPQHGDFEQKPNDHLRGQGCPKCNFESTALRCRSSTNEFIRKSKAKHGDKYNYDKVVYKSAHKKVIITCPEHGDFEQIPASHLRGAGCPKCANEQRLSKLKENEIKI